jgi:hypothetical protein
VTAIQSCDHHDHTGLIPDTRSRARMLDQLTAAQRLADAFIAVLSDEAYPIRFGVGPTGRPMMTFDVWTALPLMQALNAWCEVAPRGDDWAPPVEPPSEIRIPPEGDTAEP